MLNKINVEDRIILDRFQLRWYQTELWQSVRESNHRNILALFCRRAGKDLTCWNLAIWQCIEETCLVYYIFPTRDAAKRAIWDAITNDGTKFMDYLPMELVESINQTELKIVFKNGSCLQLMGALKYDRIRGTNPKMVILSEYAYMEHAVEIYDVIRPILAANGGKCIIITTPFGKNATWHLYQLAKELTHWKVIERKYSQILHIPEEIMEQEKRTMSHEKYMQEYELSFEQGVEGTYYGKALERLRQNGQITTVPHEPGLLTYVAIDIGVNDATTMIWFQLAGNGTVIRIIDCYSNNNLGLDHYVKILREKPYNYATNGFYAPHDLKVREWGGGAITRYEKARQLGITFTILDQIGLHDGIENVLTHFPKFWIDATKCRSLIDALENYRREWDETKQMYLPKPVHNWASHFCDSLRYLCMSIHKTTKGMTGEEFERKKMEALYGSNNHGLPRFFDPRFDNIR